MNHAEWLAKNSIDCTPLGARISKEQCEANQGHTFACETCPIGGKKYSGPKKIEKKARGKQDPKPVKELKVKQLKPVKEPKIKTPKVRLEPVAEPQSRGTKHIKWAFTPKMDALIIATYRSATGANQVNALAKQFGYPRWAISVRARTIGAAEIRLKEPNWCDEELRVLKNNAHLTPERIRLALKMAGFTRSITGVLLKRKRLGMLQNLPGQSATSLAKCFGCDAKVITGWIEKGWLKAEKRGTNRSETQGGDMYYILKSDVRNFIIDNIGVMDIRKVDKFWLIDTLTLKEAA